MWGKGVKRWENNPFKTASLTRGYWLDTKRAGFRIPPWEDKDVLCRGNKESGFCAGTAGKSFSHGGKMQNPNSPEKGASPAKEKERKGKNTRFESVSVAARVWKTVLTRRWQKGRFLFQVE